MVIGGVKSGDSAVASTAGMSSPASSDRALIAGAVGGGVGALLLATGTIAFLVWRAKRKARPHEDQARQQYGSVARVANASAEYELGNLS